MVLFLVNSTTSSVSSTKYDPDLLRSDVALARNRVARLKRELEQVNLEMQYKQQGLERTHQVWLHLLIFHFVQLKYNDMRQKKFKTHSHKELFCLGSIFIDASLDAQLKFSFISIVYIQSGHVDVFDFPCVLRDHMHLIEVGTIFLKNI